MRIPEFTAERSLYRPSEPYHMVADKNIQADEQAIIPQAHWDCTGCWCCYWTGWQWRYCNYYC
jgi:hypothetical protein